MAGEKSTREKAREIIALLPKENCGKYGFENCGKFGLAVADGEASPFGCRKNPSVGYAISKVLGIEASEGLRVAAVPPDILIKADGMAATTGPAITVTAPVMEKAQKVATIQAGTIANCRATGY